MLTVEPALDNEAAWWGSNRCSRTGDFPLPSGATNAVPRCRAGAHWAAGEHVDAHAGQAGGHLLRERRLLLPLLLLLSMLMVMGCVRIPAAVQGHLEWSWPSLRSLPCCRPRQLHCGCATCVAFFSPQVGAASEEESESDGWGDDSDSDAEEEGGEGGASKEEGEGGGGDGNTTGGEGGGGGKKEGGKKKERGAGGDYDYFDDFIDDEGGCWWDAWECPL